MVGLLTQVLLRGLPARDDRLHQDRVLLLDEGHQIHVVLSSDDENALAVVTLGVRVLEDVYDLAHTAQQTRRNVTEAE